MDFCRNVTVSGGLPSEYQPEQLLSPSCSKLGSLDDLFSTHNMEAGDVSLEWLSIFVEDCFSSSGNYSLPSSVPTNEQLQLQKTTNITSSKPLESEKPPQQNTTTTTSLLKFVIPGKARSKRKRVPLAKSKTQVTSWSRHHHHHHLHNMTGSSSDPPLLQQAYWLADSELILPQKKEYYTSNSSEHEEEEPNDEELGVGEEEKEKVMMGKEEENRGSCLEGSNGGQQQQQQPRRCSHCLAQRTPQWRAGPLGPKTLCNACGVRYKSGRLLPEYRPAKSPTFVSYKHSNSHKKVMEMRMAVLSSIPTSQ